MPIQNASEHTPTSPVTSYCTESDALTFLKGVARDDARGTLQSIWQSKEITEMFSAYLPVAKMDVDADTGIDFDYHEDVEIAVDGDGGEWADFGRWGFKPLLELSALTISDEAQTVADWLIYADGRIARVNNPGEGSVIPVPWTRPFPYGRQTVEATITWGYTEANIPADIKFACALKAGQRIFRISDYNRDNNDPGAMGGVQAIQFGDVRITTGAGGVYTRLARALKDDYQEIINRYRTIRVSSPDLRRTSDPGLTRRAHYAGWE